jgi:hypothetical protein
MVLLTAITLGVGMMSGQAVAGLKRASGKPVSTVAGSVSGGPNLKVSVVSTGRSAKTNASGFFVLSGTNLAGTHQLSFTQGQKTFSTTIRVPAGSKLSLQNTRLNNDGTAHADQEDIEAIGKLSAVDCGATPNIVTIAPSDGGTSVIMSFDATTTEIFDDSTHAKVPDCATLAANYLNAPVKAEGAQAADGSIIADRIELNSGAGKGRPGEDVHFSGIVQSENCPTSLVVQRSDLTDVTISIGSSTEINLDKSDSHASAACADIPVGAKVDVEGVPQADGSVNASQIEVRQNHAESVGSIDSLTCGTTPPSFSFTPDGAVTAITVTIASTTEIHVNDNESASCADLTTGPAKVEGVTQPDGSVAASQIEQGANGDGRGHGDDNGGGGNGGGDGGND